MRRRSITPHGPRIMRFAVLIAIWSYSAAALADTEAFDKQMEPVLHEYLKIPEALAADRTTGVVEAAMKIKELAPHLKPSTVTGEHAAHYKDIPKNLAASAERLLKAKNIEEMRDALKDLSRPMAMWATMSKPKGITVIYCSKADASWLQRGSIIANPYYGSKMPYCGEIVSGPGSEKSKDGEKHEVMRNMHNMH